MEPQFTDEETAGQGFTLEPVEDATAPSTDNSASCNSCACGG